MNEVNKKLENLANEKKTIEKKLEVYEIENEKKIETLESKLKIFGKAIEEKDAVIGNFEIDLKKIEKHFNKVLKET